MVLDVRFLSEDVHVFLHVELCAVLLRLIFGPLLTQLWLIELLEVIIARRLVLLSGIALRCLLDAVPCFDAYARDLRIALLEAFGEVSHLIQIRIIILHIVCSISILAWTSACVLDIHVAAAAGDERDDDVVSLILFLGGVSDIWDGAWDIQRQVRYRIVVAHALIVHALLEAVLGLYCCFSIAKHASFVLNLARKLRLKCRTQHVLRTVPLGTLHKLRHALVRQRALHGHFFCLTNLAFATVVP